MEKLGFDLDVDQQTTTKNQTAQPNNSQEQRRLSIQRCIDSLVHATHCRVQNCNLASCMKMKRVVEHTKSCKRKGNNGCPICKQLIALCCYHAKHCREQECVVPYCRHIKTKFRQQQMQQQFHQAQLMRRRMAVMRSIQQPPPPPPPQPPTNPTGIVNPGVGVPHQSSLPPRPPSYGQSQMTPVSAGVAPPNAVAAAQAIVEQVTSGRPTLPTPANRPTMPTGPVNPFPNAPTMNGAMIGNPLRPNINMPVVGGQPNVQQQMQTAQTTTRNWYNGNNQVQQPLTSQQPPLTSQQPPMYGAPTNPMVSQPRPIRQSRSHLQEQMTRILNILKNNQGQQTAECLQMMRENPQLMAMFLRLRQQQQQQQQQAQQRQVQQQQQQVQQQQQQQQQLQQMMQNQPVSQPMMQQQWPGRMRLTPQQQQQAQLQHQQAQQLAQQVQQQKEQQQQLHQQTLQAASNLPGLHQGGQAMASLNGMNNVHGMSNMNTMNNMSTVQSMQGMQQTVPNMATMQNVQNMVGSTNGMQGMQQQQPTQQNMYNPMQQPSPFAASNQRRLPMAQPELQFNMMQQHPMSSGQLLQPPQAGPQQHFANKQTLQQRLMSPQNTPPQQAGTLLPNQSPRSVMSPSPQPLQQPSSSPRQPTMSPSPRQSVMSPHTQPTLTSPHTIASPRPSSGALDTNDLADPFGSNRRIQQIPPLASPELDQDESDAIAPLTPSDQLSRYVDNL
jgi:E1A/CREB-binding protein